jgi:ankyrin repeat protein
MGLLAKVFGGKLIWAIDRGDAAQVEQLLKNGADPNERQLGISALTNACNRGHAGIAKLLLEKGADPNAKDWEGWSPLMAAAAGAAIEDRETKEKRCMEIVKLLVDHGADVNLSGGIVRGKTALKYADDARHKRVRELLVELGAKR